ncbi:MAG: hypothetical protein ACLFVA_00035 [Dehalococcoidia bacterium]
MLLGYGKRYWLKPGSGRWLFMSLVVLCLSLFPANPAHAALFYTGDVHIDSFSATLNVTDEAAVSVEYVLVNHGDSQEAINMTFSPSEAIARIDGSELVNPIAFDPAETRQLSLSYSLGLQTAESQGIVFAPVLFFDGMANSNRVDSYSVRLILPEGIRKIIYSSLPYTGTAEQSGRALIIWEKSDLYPTPLAISWTTLDVDIATVKNTVPETLSSPGEVVTVEVTVQNKGSDEVGDITLIDSFFPGAFEAVEPLSEFSLIQEENSDPRLYWQKEIDSLGPGETAVCSYSVKVKVLGLETRLDPAVVLIDGTSVSVSNEVILHSELAERYGAEASGGFPVLYAIIGAVIVAAIITTVFFLKSRKKA